MEDNKDLEKNNDLISRYRDFSVKYLNTVGIDENDMDGV